MHLPNPISPRELYHLIGRPDCPTLVDVITDEDFAEDPYLIPTSTRRSHQNLDSLSGPVVVTCQKGKKLSQGAAAWLRADGKDAVHLSGGMAEWHEAGLPRIPANAIPTPCTWVLDRHFTPQALASAWLIRRFVSPNARFLAVDSSEIEGTCERYAAIALPNFQQTLQRFELGTPRLSAMNKHIESLSTLLRGQYHLNAGETARIDAGMALYDALYSALSEGHDTW